MIRDRIVRGGQPIFTGACQLLDGTLVEVVVKFATTQDTLVKEIKVYNDLQQLQGRVVLKFYGAMQTETGELECVILERFGKMLHDEHFRHVSDGTLTNILLGLSKIHQGGYCHGNFAARNVLVESSNDGSEEIRIINFDNATDHGDFDGPEFVKSKCQWTEIIADLQRLGKHSKGCTELRHAAAMMRILEQGLFVFVRDVGLHLKWLEGDAPFPPQRTVNAISITPGEIFIALSVPQRERDSRDPRLPAFRKAFYQEVQRVLKDPANAMNIETINSRPVFDNIMKDCAEKIKVLHTEKRE
ncbi:hypothetical protein EIP91_007585 [Steccherinum ochraceum]|uniref:Protein kinase domain-containing protein n=1 Tax=Steccherinum ochraceum TaxID=92696 RepID=A0A4R0RUM7_9APHY|nr:hypothetical protein EIP91_007585 [Steccherinum ochraceum]